MKVLWITNILFPEASAVLFGKNDLKSSGGWMLGAAENLVCRDDVYLCVATVSSLVSEIKQIDGERIRYYVIPLEKRNISNYEKKWIEINKDFCPDIVHIHGTESPHGCAFIRACGSANVVISIQGLLSAYEPYYYYGLSKLDIYKNLTLRDIIKGSILKQQKKFRKSSKYEIEMLRNVAHIMGRTTWDRAKIWAINPEAKYYFCNETLRSEFYDGSVWVYENCLPHSIFVSQASYPIKGLHQILKALPLILRHYPDTMLRVAGPNLIETTSLSQQIKLTGYGKYLKRLVKKYNLTEHITFLGPLNADQMKDEYLRCNVFISPSSIENSPNSLGEAQILGVPCVSSYVGGSMDMMAANPENLYRFEEIEMLAFKIYNIFNNKACQANMSIPALDRHDPINNDKRLFAIYCEIINGV